MEIYVGQITFKRYKIIRFQGVNKFMSSWQHRWTSSDGLYDGDKLNDDDGSEQEGSSADLRFACAEQTDVDSPLLKKQGSLWILYIRLF